MIDEGSYSKCNKVHTSTILKTLGLLLHKAMKRLALAHNHLGITTSERKKERKKEKMMKEERKDEEGKLCVIEKEIEKEAKMQIK